MSALLRKAARRKRSLQRVERVFYRLVNGDYKKQTSNKHDAGLNSNDKNATEGQGQGQDEGQDKGLN